MHLLCVIQLYIACFVHRHELPGVMRRVIAYIGYTGAYTADTHAPGLVSVSVFIHYEYCIQKECMCIIIIFIMIYL